MLGDVLHAQLATTQLYWGHALARFACAFHKVLVCYVYLRCTIVSLCSSWYVFHVQVSAAQGQTVIMRTVA